MLAGYRDLGPFAKKSKIFHRKSNWSVLAGFLSFFHTLVHVLELQNLDVMKYGINFVK